MSVYLHTITYVLIYLSKGTSIDPLNSKKPTEVHLEPSSALIEEFVEIPPKKQTGRKKGSKTIGLSRLKQLNPVSELKTLKIMYKHFRCFF